MNIKAVIAGVHGYVPDYVLTNEELSTMVDTNDEWISTRTGIKERRILKDKSLAASDMGKEMLSGLIEKTNIDPESIDLLICATITGDRVFPDTANTILDKCGITSAYGYDVNAACSGFLYSIYAGAQYIEAGNYKRVVVLGMDVMSSIIDYSDRTTCVIFGDGGGAVLLEASDSGHGILDAVLKANGAGRKYLYMEAGGSHKPTTIDTVMAREHFVHQDGRPVFKAAVGGMVQTIEEIMERNNLTNDSLHWLIPHQANMRIITSVANGVNFPMEKVTVNIEKYGNTTAGTLPLCLWDFEDQFNPGDNIILSAFGGGFTWGTVYLKWGK
jgi:3-oxoacyl-[acyl-carrier-protein] synthase-3